jgi:hypothetical protein
VSASSDEHTAHAIVQVLARLDAALTLPRRCCDTCGCLCRRGENCPNCAIANAQARRAS